jgi:antitoxin (DNA-binding transcriptional repressor) of toxin-antitoxin stability system
MKFITVKELATKMKRSREIMSKEKVIITWKGKPIAIIRPLSEDNFENAVNEPVAAYGSRVTDKDLLKLKKAVEAIQKEAKKRGITQKDVDEAVLAVRAEMRAERNAKNSN